MKRYSGKWMMLGLMMLGFNAFAQPGGGARRDKIEAMKIGFITQKLDLSAEEAQKFWPVYNKYSDEQENSRKAFRGKVMEELADVDKMSNADADKALNDMIAFRSAEVELTKKYMAEFKRVLPTQKVVKLFVAEQQFKKELLKQLKNGRGR
ncbi:MAG: hypothetical protein SGJ00_03565 [bacterium]|nr:hypothetical protein [bacterium]